MITDLNTPGARTRHGRWYDGKTMGGHTSVMNLLKLSIRLRGGVAGGPWRSRLERMSGAAHTP